MQNGTIPIENPTTPTDPGGAPTGISGGFDMGLLLMIAIPIILIAILILVYMLYHKGKRKSTDVKPRLSDLSKTRMPLAMFMLIQGGIALGVMMGVFISLIFILWMPLLTLTTSGMSLGLGWGLRNEGMNRYRARYKDKFNLEGYLRDKKGVKHPYHWSSCTKKSTYIPNRQMIESIITQANVDITNKKDKITEKEFDNVQIMPILIDDDIMVDVIFKGPAGDVFEFVEGYDLDIFGEYPVSVAGPELRYITDLHRLTPDPEEPYYERNEWVPIFVSVWDDRRSREAVKDMPAIDIELDETHLALAKAVGVEHKYTAGEVNTDRARLLSEQRNARDFDDLVQSVGNQKATEYVRDKEQLDLLDRITEWTSWTTIATIVIFVVGITLGYMWGQNSILSQIVG